MVKQAGLTRGHSPCAIHVLAGVLIVMFVALPYQILGNNNEPVCYLKTKLDKRNTHITKIDCAEAENFHWSQVKIFETRSDVSIAELLKDNDDIRAPITSCKTGPCQDKDSERTLSTEAENTSTKGTPKRDRDTKETSSIRSHSTSMTGTEKLKNRPDDAGKTPSITTDAISMPATQMSEDIRRGTRSIRTHATWMPRTNKRQDDTGEATSITPQDVSMLATQKSQEGTSGTSSTGIHTTRVPGTNRRQDDPGKITSIVPHVTSMEGTEKNQGNTGGTPLMKAHTTSMMALPPDCDVSQCALDYNQFDSTVISCVISSFGQTADPCYGQWSSFSKCECVDTNRRISSPDGTYWCSSSGNWDPELYALKCYDPCYPDAGPNSIVQDLNGDPVTVIKDGDFVVYSCPQGYTESGTNHVLCTDGNWVAHTPFKCLGFQH